MAVATPPKQALRSTVWDRLQAVGLVPFLLYLGLSILVFGRPVIDHLGSTTVGGGTDPQAAAWMLKWWPQAIANGWGLLHADAVYVPDGFNMMWTASMPGPSLVLAPLTQLGGPLASYNVLAIAAPALNAWAAYLLCRALGADFVGGLVGGFVFGFSGYVLGHTVGGHPMLTLVPCLPLSAYLVVRHAQGGIRRGWFLGLLSLTLIFQFLTSTEMFLLLAVVGAAVLAACLALLEERRPVLRETVKWVVGAYVLTAIAVSPLLYASLAESNTLNAIDPVNFATDPVNLVIPTELIRFGGGTFHSLSARFAGHVVESGAYFGLPLLIALAAFAFQYRRRRAASILSLGFLAVLVASLGARLTVLGGVSAVRLPWTPLIHLPLFKYVLPVRLIVFAWIFAAAMVALWLSGHDHRRLRLGLGALIVVSLIPSASASTWSRPSVPSFFRDGNVEKAVGEKATLLLLPYPPAGNAQAMLWQAEDGMGFSMVGGYVSATVPADYECWPLAGHMRSEVYGADVRPELPAFLASKHVDAVVAPPQAAAVAAPLRLTRLLGPPTHTGGVLVYRVPDRIRKMPAEACPPGSG